MNKQLFLVIAICVHGTNTVQAQWTKQDSVWLQKILSGKEQIHLNEETRKAIKQGTLISPDITSAKEQMKSAPTTIPITKDFSEYIKPKVIERRADPYSMPPAVYLRYTLEAPFVFHNYNKAAFAVPDEVKANAPRPSGISFNDMLMRAFNKKERYKQINRKHAKAWKSYSF